MFTELRDFTGTMEEYNNKVAYLIRERNNRIKLHALRLPIQERHKHYDKSILKDLNIPTIERRVYA